MTDEERQALSEEWQRNEARINELPDNHAERQRLLQRQDEIEYLAGLEDLRQRRGESDDEPSNL
jgi:hypothetical protein